MLLHLKAARSWHAPPGEYLGGAQGWTYVSRTLAAALTYLDEIRCPRGHYTDDTTDPDAEGWYEVDDSMICEACAALDRYHKDHEHSPPEPGALLFVRDTYEDEEA